METQIIDRKVAGKFKDGRVYYRDKNCWKPTDLQRHIILFSKRHYKWETDEQYEDCLTKIFAEFYMLLQEHISLSIILSKVKETLKIATEQPYYRGNNFERVQEMVENEVFFNGWFDKKKEFTKDEIVKQLIFNYLVQISHLSVFHQYGKHFADKEAEWVMSIDLGKPNPKIYKCKHFKP